MSLPGRERANIDDRYEADTEHECERTIMNVGTEHDVDGGRDEMIHRPGWLTWMHGAGVVLSLVALVIRDLSSPAIGFPIAIAVLAGLGVPSSPKPHDSDVLRIIHGGVLEGGIRQGVFIKGMFAVALLYMGIHGLATAGTGSGVTDLLLGAALATSSVASEIEAKQIRAVLEGDDPANYQFW